MKVREIFSRRRGDVFDSIRVLTFYSPSLLSSYIYIYIYTYIIGLKFFEEEIDVSQTGKVTLDDLKFVMRRRKLPAWYAKKFFDRAKPNYFSRSIEWEDFKSVMNERESKMLKAYNSLSVGRSGMLKENDVKTSLGKLGLPATDENAKAMLRHLALSGNPKFISYGQFRNFMMLLPQDVVAMETDPSKVWFEAATMVEFAKPQGSGGTFSMALKAALAGGCASAMSTSTLHPIDTLKTRLQATVGKGPGMLGILKSVPRSPAGVRTLYQGILPSVTGNFFGHGMRAATYEIARLALGPLTIFPMVSEITVQGMSAGVGTLVGTCVRIPCEVLKQKLQTQQYSNVFAAVKGVTSNGPRPLFAGTAATLTREIPFYMIGMTAYEQFKIIARSIKGEELSSHEFIAIGGAAGAVGSLATTPFDVLKTRAMTGRSPVGEAMLVTIKNIIATEGPRALFKGALFRIAWIAPLGAMNFAGYELAKRAMGGDENSTTKSEDAMKVATTTTTTTSRHSAPASATISTSHTPTKSSAAAVSSSRTDLAKLQNNKQKRADVPEEDENVYIEEEQLPSGPQYPSEEDFGDFFDDNDDIKKDDDERKSK
jgi:Ca2+-binding EF-hand superfamily protein